MATKIHFTIDQGSEVSQTLMNLRTINGSAVNLANSSATCVIKKNYTANTGFTLGVVLGINGSITVVANSAYTSSFPPGMYVYDVLVLTPEISPIVADYQRVVEGFVTVNAGVTSGANNVFYNNVPAAAPAGEGGGTVFPTGEGAAIPNTD